MGSYTNRNTTNYPPYLQTAHENLLSTVRSRVLSDRSPSPLYGRDDIEIDDLFFEAGNVIGNYPALFDVYGKFMAGLDINILLEQVINDTTDGNIINTFVSDKTVLIGSEIDNSINRFDDGISDITASVNSISIIGNSLIRDRETKLISRFQAEVKYKLLPIAIDRWSAHLSWNKAVVSQYIEIIKLYYKLKIDVTNVNLELNTRDQLWPLDLLEFERSILGLLTGAGSSSSSGKSGGGPSDLEGALGGAMSGAAMGASFGPYGMAIGAVLGAAASFL